MVGSKVEMIAVLQQQSGTQKVAVSCPLEGLGKPKSQCGGPHW